MTCKSCEERRRIMMAHVETVRQAALRMKQKIQKPKTSPPEPKVDTPPS